MHGVLSAYDHLVQWPFMIAVMVGYISVAMIGKALMSFKKDPIIVPKILPIIYNAIQVSLSAYMTWGIFGGLDQPLLFGINNAFTNNLEYFLFVHYLSKYLDFVDTILIIFKKDWNRLSLLHAYHHASIPMIWGYILLIQVNGTATWGAGINSLIHTIMYFHYLVTSLGFNNPFKKYVTQAQLVQFVMCVYHSICVFLYENSVAQSVWYLQFFYQLSMIALFSRFYTSTYQTGARRGGVNPPKEK